MMDIKGVIDKVASRKLAVDGGSGCGRDHPAGVYCGCVWRVGRAPSMIYL